MIEIFHGDALTRLREMPASSIDCCVTSPPYWALRDYGVAGQFGLEETPEQWCQNLVGVFREVRRVLKPTGTLWLNCGDSYISKPHGYGETHDPKYKAGRNRSHERLSRGNRQIQGSYKSKDLVGQAWMLAFGLRSDGWYLRRDIIWHKPNCMPESAKDRPTTAHEYIFLLSKSETYFYDYIAVMEPTTGNSHARGSGVNPKAVGGWEEGHGRHSAVEFSTKRVGGSNSRMRVDRDPHHQTPAKVRAKQNRSFSAAVAGLVSQRNCRSVWSIPTAPFRGAHFATFPPRLVERCIRAGSSERGCCSICGAPWVRTVHSESLPRIETTPRQARKWTEIEQRRNRRDNPQRGVLGSGVSHNVAYSRVSAVGWEPTCSCSLAGDPVPAMILDPFAGACTTLMVAEGLGRSSVGIEISAEYIAMASRRLFGEESTA